MSAKQKTKQESTGSEKQTPEVAPHNFTYDGNEVLILRRCGKDRKAHGGFTYPVGVGSVVTAPDWTDRKTCGGGLHGWPWSFGLGDGQDFDVCNDVWIILGAAPGSVVGELEGGWKCKCRTATIRFEGSFKDAMDRLRDGFTACVKAITQVNKTGASSGDDSQNASSGDDSRNASSGDDSQIEATGKKSTAAISGERGCVKVAEGGAFALAHKLPDGTWDFATGKAGVNGIKADTWYEVVDGKIAEKK